MGQGVGQSQSIVENVKHRLKILSEPWGHEK